MDPRAPTTKTYPAQIANNAEVDQSRSRLSPKVKLCLPFPLGVIAHNFLEIIFRPANKRNFIGTCYTLTLLE